MTSPLQPLKGVISKWPFLLFIKSEKVEFPYTLFFTHTLIYLLKDLLFEQLAGAVLRIYGIII